MPSLKLHLDYFDHPKTCRLIGLLGRGAEVIPVRLWCYCGRYHAETGRLAAHAAQEIETRVGWWGTPGKALAALVECGFLDVTDEGYQVHDWEEHAGHLIAYKLKAKNAARSRWDASSNARSNAKGLRGAGGPHVFSIKPTLTNNQYPNSNSPEGGIVRAEIPEGELEVKKARAAPFVFKKPTLEELTAYIREKNYTFDPQSYLAFYESNGWKVGKNAMKNWKAACVTWQKNSLSKPVSKQPVQPQRETPEQAEARLREVMAENRKKMASDYVAPVDLLEFGGKARG